MRASARAGVGAAGLALVGCGDDDDDAQQTAAQAQQQAQQQQAQPQAQQQAMQQQQAEDQAEQQAQAVEEQEQAAVAVAEEQEVANGEIDTEATLRLALAADNGGLDPHRSGSQVNYQNSHSVFSKPVEFDPDTGNPIGILVTWELPDEVTWNMNVTDGVFFHNGQQLTAEDIIFTYERVGNIAEYHQGGEASDHPGGWASARTQQGAHHCAGYAQTDKPNWQITTNAPDATIAGAFMGNIYTMSKADTDFVFERNEEHHLPWSAKPSPIAAASHKRQVHFVRPEPLSRIAGIEAGEIDVAYALTPDVVDPILDDPNFKVGSGWAGNPNQYLLPNLLTDEVNGVANPFRDERVRKALNHAINKQAIIDGLMTGKEGVSYGAWAGASFYPKEALEAIGPYEYDPDLAKALLAEAGFPDGFTTPFHFSVDFIPTDPQVALVIQQDLAAVGVELELRSYGTGEFFATARNAASRETEAAGLFFMQNCACIEPEIMIAVHIAPTPGGTYSLAPHDDLMELRARTKTAVDPVERAAAIEELYVKHYQRAGFIYLTERYAFHVTAANIDWQIGAAQVADMHKAYQINVLKT